MTTAATNADPLPATAIAARLGAAVRATLAGMKARHDRRQLLALDDCHLRDMGVSRGDFRRALGAE